MTTYRAIASTETDPEAPITSALMKALQGNVLAIAEQDASVPDAWKIGFVLLGTVNTTSGSTQTLSSLTLTAYRSLYIVANGVSFTFSAISLQIAGAVVSAATSTAGGGLFGSWTISLANGVLIGSAAELGAAPSVNSPALFVARTGITTATTSISFSTTGVFDAGSIFIYGVK